jgi:hypothetical protein
MLLLLVWGLLEGQRTNRKEQRRRSNTTDDAFMADLQ